MPISPISACLELLGRDSRLGSRAGQVVSYLMDLLYYGEFQIFEQVSSGGAFERVNLIGVKGNRGQDRPLWLIGGFASSVNPTPQRWAQTAGDPLRPRHDREAGLLYGLGANAKIDIALKILAASRFRAEELARPIVIAALAGEEARGAGVRSLLSSGPAPNGAAIIGAPTNLELWTDHPGCVIIEFELRRKLRHRRMPPCQGFFELSVTGASAHAQAASSGQDALAAGIALLDALRVPGDIRLLHFAAGEAGNRVPGRCSLRIATSYDTLPTLPPGVTAEALADGTALAFPIDHLFAAWMSARDAGVAAAEPHTGIARLPVGARPRTGAHTGSLVSDRNSITGQLTLWRGPGASTEEICEAFAQAAQHALIGEDEIEVDIRVVQDRPALSGQEGSEILLGAAREALVGAGIVPTVTGGLATTDAAMLRAQGMETLVFGPGRGLHDCYRDDELMPVAHIEAAYRFYTQLIARWCLDTGAG